MKAGLIKIAKILLIDDSEEDVDLVRMAIAKAKWDLDLHVVSDGEEAIDYLQNRKKILKDLPDLILLDINMPRMNGLEVLQLIKTDPQLKKIPVTMLTNSHERNDIENCYNKHANCYLEKPLDHNSFSKMIEQYKQFWCSFVTLPHDF